MGKTLSQEEIRQRLVRLNNVERLHKEQKATIALLRKENKELKEKLVSRDKIIEDLELQIEELKIKVYGKKKDGDDNDNNPKPPKDKVIRTEDSYKRPIPKEEEITETKNHSIDFCPDCKGKITDKETTVFYEEDIPVMTRKICIKHEVEKGYCPRCKAWHGAEELPYAKVILGPNIQKYICYLSSICRLSFSCVQNLLQNTYQIKVSQGEISKMLEREAMHLLPFYEELKKKIRSEPMVHMDETSWRLFENKASSYGWIMCGAISKKKVFMLGKTRGGGNTEELAGKDYQGTVVSDDYAAYDKFKGHQLCWAHLLRKFRDLASSTIFTKEQIEYCKAEYEKLCKSLFKIFLISMK